MKKHSIRSFSMCFLLAITLLLAACQAQQTSKTGSIPSNSPTPAPIASPTPVSTTSPTPVSTTSPTPVPTASSTPVYSANAPDSSCPAAGQARAMNLSTTVGQADAVIVYDYTQLATNKTSLRYYDVKTKTTNTFYAPAANQAISNPVLSADGKWVLFISYNSGGGTIQRYEKLQAISTNGQMLQTLYCTDNMSGLTGIAWSPDMAHIAFGLVSYAKTSSVRPGGLYLLNTASGTLHTLPSEAPYNAIAWHDATHLYVSEPTGAPAPPYLLATQKLTLVDITGGANQVQTVFANPHNIYWNASLSPDGQRLSISETKLVNDTTLSLAGPANIVVQPATGGQDTSIFRNQTQGNTEVCAATNNTLLVSISAALTTTHPAPFSSDGLYRMNANGTKPVKLFPLDNTNVSVRAGCTYSAQTVSRDGSMYAFEAGDGQIGKLYVGTLNSNSQPTVFAETSNRTTGKFTDNIGIIGWTMLS